MGTQMNSCYFTAVCAADERWVPLYLAMVEETGVPFVVHLDKWHCRRMTSHRMCVGVTSERARAFDEQHKQAALDLVRKHGFKYAVAMDVDEVWESGLVIPETEADLVVVRWLNLWEDAKYVRVDGEYPLGYRAKVYNLQGDREWKFRHPVVNGASLLGRELTERSPLVCLHAGLMTHKLRVEHLARWDRLYSQALRGDSNPYSYWKNTLDSESSAVTVMHGYWNEDSHAKYVGIIAKALV